MGPSTSELAPVSQIPKSNRYINRDVFDDIPSQSHSRKYSSTTPFSKVLTLLLLAIVVIESSYLVYRPTEPTSSDRVPTTHVYDDRSASRRGSIPTRFMSTNQSKASEAWAGIKAGHGLVAIDPLWAAARGLPNTITHPLDPNKAVYIIEAYHSIHCLKYIRQHFISILSSADPPAWSLEHDFHCFDAIRQQIMCHADDTLLYTTGNRDAGVNQTRQCRDWDALREWATERTACYFDYEAPVGETRWGKCDGGDDGLPRGSLLD